MDEIRRSLKAKVPWWTYPLRWWNLWKIDRKEKQQAVAFRQEEEERLKTPVYFGVVTGRTKYVDKPEGKNIFNTHYWYLYETPEGKRSWKGEISAYADKYGCTSVKEHPYFGQIVLPWINHQLDLDQQALLKGEVRIWNRIEEEE